MDLAFNPEVDMRNENFIKQKLVQGEIINCQMIPLLEGCRLSPGIFDSNFNKYYDHINQGVQKRGGEDYISPLKWTAYGINVLGKYDFGDNRWLSNDGEPGEYAVAYYGINNLNLHNIQMMENIMSLMGNLESGNTFVEDVNLRNPGQKCMSGAYFYKNPSFAENSSEIINIGGFEYKIMFMCRVNPSKIRQPQNFPDCWILSPTPDEIRPYKILIKKIPKSPLAIGSQQRLKMYYENNPPQSYFEILRNKNEWFFTQNNLGLSNLDYALRIYTNGSYINSYLREGQLVNGLTEDQLKSTVWCLHKAITQDNVIVPVQNGTILYRGVCFKLPNNIGIGTTFYFPEFLSSSRDINIAKSFGRSGTLMYITVKNNGTNGNKIYCRDVEYITSCKGQKEIIFTLYCRFKITKIEKNPTWDIMHLTCEGPKCL